MAQRWYWIRLTPPAGVLMAALGGALWSWRVSPPVGDLAGSARNMRNIPGDLRGVLILLIVELCLVVAVMQPWRQFPQRRWIGLGGLCLGLWGVIRFLVGLHSPPAMLPHDMAMLVLGVVLCFSALAFPLADASGDHR